MAPLTSRRWRRRGLLRCEYYLNIVPASRMRVTKTRFSPSSGENYWVSVSLLPINPRKDRQMGFMGLGIWGTSIEPPIRGLILRLAKTSGLITLGRAKWIYPKCRQTGKAIDRVVGTVVLSWGARFKTRHD